jgi:hypothetical protein
MAVSYSRKEKLVFDVFDSNDLSKDVRLGKVDVKVSNLIALARSEPIEDPEFHQMVADGLKAVLKATSLDVWVPLYTREEAKAEDLVAVDASAAKAKKTSFLNPIASGMSMMNAISSTVDIKGKKKQKGLIHFELELLPIKSDSIIEHTIPDATKNIESEKADEKRKSAEVAPFTASEQNLAIETKPIQTAKDRVLSNRTGILRFKIESGLFLRPVRAYLEFCANDQVLYSTLTSFESSEQCNWLGSTDQFVVDLLAIQFTIYVRDQQDFKPSHKDPIIGFWAGDLIDQFVGKGLLTLPLRQYSENWANFSSLPLAGEIDILSMYYPVNFGTFNSVGSMESLILIIRYWHFKC